MNTAIEAIRRKASAPYEPDEGGAYKRVALEEPFERERKEGYGEEGLELAAAAAAAAKEVAPAISGSSPRLPIWRMTLDPGSVPIDVAVACEDLKVDVSEDEIEAIFRTQTERLLRAPQVLVSALLDLQCTKLNPADVESSPALRDIVQHVSEAKMEMERAGLGGDAAFEYDCFISYRVAAEANTAEKLYLYLQKHGLRPFWDNKCLKKGEPWRSGFLQSLRQSRTFVPLVSNRGLEQCKDVHRNHAHDNLLLEVQTALSIKDVRERQGVKKYILPVLVGALQNDGSYLQFQDSQVGLLVDTVESQVLLSFYRSWKESFSSCFRGTVSCLASLSLSRPCKCCTCVYNAASYTLNIVPKELLTLLSCVGFCLVMTIISMFGIVFEKSRYDALHPAANNVTSLANTTPSYNSSRIHAPDRNENDAFFKDRQLEVTILLSATVCFYLSFCAGVFTFAISACAYMCGLGMSRANGQRARE